MEQETDIVGDRSATTQPSTGVPVDPQVAKARAAWAQLGQKWQRVTPSQLFRFLLAAVALGALGWLTVSLLDIMVPFEIGVVLAYVTIPLVDWLNKWMPRPVAIGLVMLVEFGVIVGALGALIPVLINQVGIVLDSLPSQVERQRFFNDLVVQLRAVLPPAAQDWARNSAQQAAQDVQQNAATYVTGLLGIIGSAVLGIVGTLSFALSLLVLPTWLFAVLRDRNRAVRFVNSVLPETWRADFWAPLRIADRSLGFYLRGLFLQAIAVAAGTWIGTQVLQAVGYGPFRYPVLLAVIIGFTQLIPTFGPFVGYILGGLAGLTRSPEDALATVVMLVAVQILNNVFVASKIQNKVVDLHPAIVAVLLVAGSRFGLLGVLLAAPLGVMFRDLYRYVNGRLADPPRPAGLLPGAANTTSAGATAQRAGQSATQLRVPSSVGIPYRSATPAPSAYPGRVQRKP